MNPSRRVPWNSKQIARDRWVNFNIDLIVASDTVGIDATPAEKMDAMEKVVDDLIDVLETSGFQARHEVLSAAHEDVEEGEPR